VLDCTLVGGALSVRTPRPIHVLARRARRRPSGAAGDDRLRQSHGTLEERRPHDGMRLLRRVVSHRVRSTQREEARHDRVKVFSSHG
jgi:hypothetical protein